MKSIFSCFYEERNDSELKRIWTDEKTLFVFDTNVLLGLYSFQPENRSDFFKALELLNGRAWIPYHVGLEYQRNRLQIIKNRRKFFTEMKKRADELSHTISFDQKLFTTFQNEFSLIKNFPTVNSKIQDIQQNIKDKIDTLNVELRKSITELKVEITSQDKDGIFLNSEDIVRNQIDDFFTNEKVGKNIFDTQDKLNNLFQEGEDRYKKGIPPGFEDAKQKGEDVFYFSDLEYKSKFGDLIIFKQIVDYAKEKTLKNVIFISEDTKSDWRINEEFEGKKILGARVELKNEIYDEAGVEHFSILKIDEFLTKSKIYLNVNIEDSSIQDIKDSLKFKDKKFIIKFDLTKEHDNNESIKIGEADKFIEFLKYKKFKDDFVKSGNIYYDDLVEKKKAFENKYGEFNEKKFIENMYFLNENLSEEDKQKLRDKILRNILSNKRYINKNLKNDDALEPNENDIDEE
ncbi:PIN-like domain-containing protein (plasmid) [Acinetobacter sp. A1-4-2]|uniref:PIN-like domain-containing protein n=1 Tax=Acinetobacter sp. A1-4-2 TaxID=3156489 RepID=A0AAU7T155_9GAMM